VNVAIVATLTTSETPVVTAPLAAPASFEDHCCRNSLIVTTASPDASALTMWMPRVADAHRSRSVSQWVPFRPISFASRLMAGISTTVSRIIARRPAR
jgi:hypothetical protein